MKRIIALAFVGVFLFSGTVFAELIKIGTASYLGNDYNLIYQNDGYSGGLVWLDYSKSSIENGQPGLVAWASELGNHIAVSLDPGYSTKIDWGLGWRLPATDETKVNLAVGFGYSGPDASGYYSYSKGYNMRNSEMGHLYYEELGNLGFHSTSGNPWQPGYGLNNTDIFENLLDEHYYSGTEYSIGYLDAWWFAFNDGYQSADGMYVGHRYGLAVRPGTVSFSGNPVPKSATLFLLGTGLTGLAAAQRRKKQ